MNLFDQLHLLIVVAASEATFLSNLLFPKAYNFNLLIVVAGIKLAWNIVTGDVVSTTSNEIDVFIDKDTAKKNKAMTFVSDQKRISNVF